MSSQLPKSPNIFHPFFFPYSGLHYLWVQGAPLGVLHLGFVHWYLCIGTKAIYVKHQSKTNHAQVILFYGFPSSNYFTWHIICPLWHLVYFSRFISKFYSFPMCHTVYYLDIFLTLSLLNAWQHMVYIWPTLISSVRILPPTKLFVYTFTPAFLKTLDSHMVPS